MYTQTTAIAISSILFVFMLIGFVAQTAGSRAERYDFFAFDNPGIEMLIVEIFALFYSFGFVLWQTQLSHFFYNNSDDIYRLIVGLCMALGLIWCCALVSSLVAYTYNALLLFLLFANMLQSVLVPYALFQLKNQHQQYPPNSAAQQRQLNEQLQEQSKLLEELRVIKRKLEHAEANKNETAIGTELTHSTIDTDYDRPARIIKVSFADQPETCVNSYEVSQNYYR